MKHPTLGHLDLNRGPAVVGTVIDLSVVDPGRIVDCDVVELRVDQIGVDSPGWVETCSRLERTGKPVILTIRHQSEGGGWTGSAAERLVALKPVLGIVSAIDVEIGSEELPGIRAAADRPDLVLLGSYHDFDGFPDEEALDRVTARGIDQGATIVKIAARTESENEVDRLRSLMDRFPDISFALLGMGSQGPTSRLSLPRAGSCLTYGFLDEAVAPGQVSAGSLHRELGTAFR